MPYFACFRKHNGCQFRLDTRIYIRDDQPSGEDVCVGAIVGKNPGSANGKQFDRLAPISLDGDKLLPFVRRRFQNAYKRAGIKIPSGAYVRVWNLFYLCDKNLKAALDAYGKVKRPLGCASESAWPPIVWFAWGPPREEFAAMQTRFRRRGIEHPFYFDMDLGEVVAGVPGPERRVKHTQGLRGAPVEEHLASILLAEGRAKRHSNGKTPLKRRGHAKS